MTFNHANRRTHLYLGMALLPWFLMYGFSSVFFAHRPLEDHYRNDGIPQFSTRWVRDVRFTVPEDRLALRALGDSIAVSLGETGPFYTGTFGNGGFRMYKMHFTDKARLTYNPREGTLTWEDARFRWDQFFTGMHARGGFRDGFPIQTIWSILVDVFCIAAIVWIASGLCMWWQLDAQRRWGTITLGLGALSFTVFMISF